MKLSPKQSEALKAIWHHGQYQIFKFHNSSDCEIKDEALRLHLARTICYFIDADAGNRKVKLDFKKLLTDSDCETWRLLLWSHCDYKLLDFSGYTEGEEYGALALLDTKTDQLTFISKVEDGEVEPLVNNRDITDIFIDYEEWRCELN